MRPDLILAHDFGAVRQSYTLRDAILYALGVGLGRDPLDGSDLPFLDETRLAVLPTFAVTLSSPGMWMRRPEYGIDFRRLVHLAQAARFHSALPTAGEVVGSAEVVSLSDRGEGRGAVLEVERRIAGAGGAAYCTLRQTLLLRGNGGFGGPPAETRRPPAPDRAPDLVTEAQTSPRAALIYRLSGDWNPLHIDPGFARAAGFERPILQGLASYAAAGVAVARALGRSPTEVAALSCRFAGVVYPGETLAFDIWREDDGAVFRATVSGRPALEDGRVAFGDQP